MIGDKLVITDYHKEAAAKVHQEIERRQLDGGYAVSVSGESGCGKSETAQCLEQLLAADGKRCVVLGQDDYFKLPPKSNHNRRVEDIGWVGMGEVKLDLLDEHVASLKQSTETALTKPLVYYDDDRVGTEQVQGPFDVVIVEGTYTASLSNVDIKAFIDRDYRQTKKARLKRGRDPDVAFLEKVLSIEHEIISAHKKIADVIIDPPPEER